MSTDTIKLDSSHKCIKFLKLDNSSDFFTKGLYSIISSIIDWSVLVPVAITSKFSLINKLLRSEKLLAGHLFLRPLFEDPGIKTIYFFDIGIIVSAKIFPSSVTTIAFIDGVMIGKDDLFFKLPKNFIAFCS